MKAGSYYNNLLCLPFNHNREVIALSIHIYCTYLWLNILVFLVPTLIKHLLGPNVGAPPSRELPRPCSLKYISNLFQKIFQIEILGTIAGAITQLLNSLFLGAQVLYVSLSVTQSPSHSVTQSLTTQSLSHSVT